MERRASWKICSGSAHRVRLRRLAVSVGSGGRSGVCRGLASGVGENGFGLSHATAGIAQMFRIHSAQQHSNRAWRRLPTNECSQHSSGTLLMSTRMQHSSTCKQQRWHCFDMAGCQAETCKNDLSNGND